MVKKRGFPKIFFGWWTALAGGIICMWAVGYRTYGFSALFKPIAAELGFSRAQTSVATSIGTVAGGIEGPLVGGLSDRFGPKWLIFSGVCLIGLGLILLRFIDSLWTMYLVWGIIIETGFNIGTIWSVDRAVANWFVRKRGKALGIKWVIQGLSGTLVLPLLAWLISTQGWRMASFIGGVVMLAIGLPLTLFFIKQHRPEYYGLLPDGATVKDEAGASRMIDKGVKYAADVEEVEFTVRQTMRTPAFWMLAASNAAHSMAATAITVHGIPFMTDVGLDPLVAAGIMGMMVSVSIPFRLVGGFLADRVRKGRIRFLVVAAYSLQALGFALFLLTRSIPMIYVWFILYGIGHGLIITPVPALRARYFGRKTFGSIQGIVVALQTPVGMAAPIYAGWVYDTTGSYITAFIIMGVLLVFAAILASLVLPPKPPAKITDISKLM